MHYAVGVFISIRLTEQLLLLRIDVATNDSRPLFRGFGGLLADGVSANRSSQRAFGLESMVSMPCQEIR